MALSTYVLSCMLYKYSRMVCSGILSNDGQIALFWPFKGMESHDMCSAVQCSVIASVVYPWYFNKYRLFHVKYREASQINFDKFNNTFLLVWLKIALNLRVLGCLQHHLGKNCFLNWDKAVHSNTKWNSSPSASESQSVQNLLCRSMLAYLPLSPREVCGYMFENDTTLSNI